MIPPEYLNTITTGDARELAKRIPDNSVDLIFTDPPYAEIHLYEWLSREATRVLKPGSACLAYCGIGYLPQTHDAMRNGGLSYRWRLVTRMVMSKEFHGRLQVTTQECLWYEKGHSKPYGSIWDCDFSTTKGMHMVDGSNWGKGNVMLYRYLNAFSRPGDIVWEPFAGSGSIPSVCKMLNRRYIAFEVNPISAERARLRVEQTQPPLPGLEVEQQTAMEWAG